MKPQQNRPAENLAPQAKVGTPARQSGDVKVGSMHKGADKDMSSCSTKACGTKANDITE